MKNVDKKNALYKFITKKIEDSFVFSPLRRTQSYGLLIVTKKHVLGRT